MPRSLLSLCWSNRTARPNKVTPCGYGSLNPNTLTRPSLAATHPLRKGLGKTMQCAAFLAGLLGSGLARRALIIAPKTLLPHWAKELRVCGLAGLTKEYFGSSVAERNAALRAVAGGGGGGYGGGAAGRGVLVTTYGMVQHNAEELTGPRDALRGSAAAARGEQEFCWDVVLLDEGHKIKAGPCGVGHGWRWAHELCAWVSLGGSAARHCIVCVMCHSGCVLYSVLASMPPALSIPLQQNPKMKLVEQLRKLPARVRVIISGTPIQVRPGAGGLAGSHPTHWLA